MYNIINWNNAARKANEQLEFLPLTCTPHDEICTPAGKDEDNQIKECTALINQLIREQGNPPEGAEYFIIINTGHEFGIYYEAGIFYIPTQDNETEVSISENYALKIETSIPDKWDIEALNELRNARHTNHQPAKVIQLKRA